MTALFPHQPGDRVRHPWLGTGTIREVGERYLAIVFDQKGEALVKIDDADLEPEGGYPGAVPDGSEDERDEAGASEIPPASFDPHAFEPGDRVDHFKFGAGTVLSTKFSNDLGDLGVTVRFDRDRRERVILAGRLVRTALADLDWPDDTFTFEEGEGDPHGMGSHWDAFGGADSWIERIPEILGEQDIQTGFGEYGRRPGARDIPPDWPVGYIGAWPSRENGVCTVHKIDEENERIDLVSMFPFCADGSKHVVELNEVRVWKSGCEAQITGMLGESEISFYDARYLADRAGYKAGRPCEFILTGIAYGARPVVSEPFTVRQDPEVAAWIARMHRESGREVLPELEPTFSMKGMASLLPVPEWDIDDHAFRGPVQSVREIEVLGEAAWLLEVTVLRFSEDVNLKILATRRIWEAERPPQVGEDIEGRLWLQGYLLGISGSSCG